MPYPIPVQTSIRDNILRDHRNLDNTADVADDSDNWIRASATSNAIDGLYAHQQWISKQIFADTADDDNVLHHASLRGVNLLPGVPSAGKVKLVGTPGMPFPAGLSGRRPDGVIYTTQAGGNLGADGVRIVAAKANAPGVQGDCKPGIVLTISETPAGLANTCEVVEMVGGVEQETVAHLLERYLDLIRRPPAGGNKSDYRRWAKEVAGVTEAYVYPLRRGLGTVDVVIVSGGNIPSQQTIAATQAHIDDVRPVTAKNALVLAATVKPVDFTIQVRLFNVSLADATANIKASLASYFTEIIPGKGFVKSVAEMQISAVAGVTDRVVLAPAGNIDATINAAFIEWLRLGNVTVRLLP